MRERHIERKRVKEKKNAQNVSDVPATEKTPPGFPQARHTRMKEGAGGA